MTHRLRLPVAIASASLALSAAAPAAAGIVFRSSTSGATAGTATALRISAPPTVPGDVVVAAVTARLQDTTGTVSPPAGWALVRSDTSGSAPAALVQVVYVHVAGFSEPTGWTFSLTRATAAAGGIAAYSGVNTAAPVDAAGGRFATNTASIVAPSVTATVSGDQLLGIFGHNAPGTITAPTGMVRRWSVFSSNSYNASSAVADASLMATGATGNRVATTATVRQSVIGQLVALRPAGAAPPPGAPPAISNVRVAAVTLFSAQVSWTTDRPATSRVELGMTSSYGVWTAGDATATTSHTVTIPDLHWATAYHARPLSATTGGVTTGPDVAFTTAALPTTRRTSSVGSQKQILLDGHPFFPVMQFAQCPSLFEQNVALGVDTFFGKGCSSQTDAQEVANTQARNALSVIEWGPAVINAPSLLGWRFIDEPDSKPVYPSEIQSQYSRNRSQDPGHLNFLTLTPNFFSRLSPPSWMNGDRSIYKQYTAAADVPGFDIYPIYGWCRPDRIWWEADATREFATIYAPTKPIYSWIEAAATSSKWCTGRGVYDYEVRAEVWMTIANGAKAIGYFTHSWAPTYSQFRVSAEVQAEMKRTDRQIRTLAPALLAPAASVNRTVLTTGGRIDYIARDYAGATYVFAVNVNRTAADVRFSAPQLAGRKATVWEEGRTLTADAGGSFTDTFAPLAVHVYVVPPPAS